MEARAARRPTYLPHTSTGGYGAAIRNSDLIEVALVALVFSASLFNAQVGPLSPLAVMGVIPAYVWLRYERVAGLLAACWPVLLLPGFALISVAWSIAPGETLRYGTLYAATAMAGIIFGGGIKREPLLIGLFMAFGIYNVVALLFGHSVSWGGGAMGNQAFSGLAGGKNQSGEIAALGLLITLATGGLGIIHKRPLLVLATLAALPATAWILWESHATGSLIAGGIAAMCLVLWLASQGLPRQLRTGIFVVAIIAVVLAGASQSVWAEPLFKFVLKSAGKDPGLTGRAYIWYRADALIHARPLLGLGYGAFWIPGNLDAEGIWRFAGIPGKSGFNFHNTGREILVHLGWTGLVVYAVIMVTATAALLIRSMIVPHTATILFAALTIFFGMRLGVEALGFVPINYGAMMMFTIYAMGFASIGKAANGDVDGLHVARRISR